MQWMSMLGLGGRLGGSSSTSSAASASTPPGAPSFDLSALLANSGIPPNTATPAPTPAPTPGMFNLPPAPNSAGGNLTVEDMQRVMQADAGRRAPSNLADV